MDREPGRHLGAACDADAAVPGGDGGPVGVYGAALEADVTCYLGVCGAVGLYRDDAFCAAVNGAGAWASDGDGPGGDALVPTSVGESFVPMVFSPTKWMVVSPGTMR